MHAAAGGAGRLGMLPASQAGARMPEDGDGAAVPESLERSGTMARDAARSVPADVVPGAPAAWSAEARWQSTLHAVGMKRAGDVPLPPLPPRGPSASRRAVSTAPRRGAR